MLKKDEKKALTLLWVLAAAAAVFLIAGDSGGGGILLDGVAGFWSQSQAVYWTAFGVFLGVFLSSLRLAIWVAGQKSPSRRVLAMFAILWALPFGCLFVSLFSAVCGFLGVWGDIGIREVGGHVESGSVSVSLTVWAFGTAMAGLLLWWLSRRHPWQTLQKMTATVLHVLVVVTVLIALVVDVFAIGDAPIIPYFKARGSHTGFVLGAFVYLWLSGVALARSAIGSQDKNDTGRRPVPTKNSVRDGKPGKVSDEKKKNGG